MGEQRFYWLKLNKDFFKSKRIKKLRKLAGGDTFTIIYLKMQLLATPTEGVLTYTGLEETAAEEIALDIDEDPENVKVTLQYLLKTGLCEMLSDTELFLPFVVDNTGSEGSSAKRVRDFRNRKKALQCNTAVTEVKQIVNGEIEIEKEIELEKEKDINTSIDKSIDVCTSFSEVPQSQYVFQEIVDKWNTLSEFGIPKINRIPKDSPRVPKIRKRLKEYGAESFDKVIEEIRNSDFLLGRTSSRGRDPFNLDFDWIIGPSNYTKVFEGKYRNKNSRIVETPEAVIDPEEEARQRAWEEGFHDA